MVQHIHAVLRRALEQARRDEIVPRNVATLVQPPRVPRHEYRWLTEDEARQLVGEVRQDRPYPIYALALGLGLRRGELLGLRWVDVDLEAGTIVVRRSLQRLNGRLQLVEPKTKRSYRQVPLPHVCVEALQEQCERQQQEREESPVWLDDWGLAFTAKHGTPIEPRNLLRHFYGACERLGLPRLRFHDLRHGARDGATCAYCIVVWITAWPSVSMIVAVGTPRRWTTCSGPAADPATRPMVVVTTRRMTSDSDSNRETAVTSGFMWWSGTGSNRRPRDFQSY